MKEKLIVTADNMEDAELYLKAGADEVVFALENQSISALHPFSLDNLPQKMPYSLLLNRMYFEEDLAGLQDLLHRIESMPVQNIYFADPAVVQLAGNLKDQLIYRPETLAVSSNDVHWWLSQGIHSVSISPLLTEEEFLSVVEKNPSSEATIHGHLLMSVSRRPLLSAYETYGEIREKLHDSRNLTLVEMKREGHMPVYENNLGTMIYTDFVQESFAMVQKLKDAGCERFYIDSVYSNAEDIAEAVRCYRSILNGADGISIGKSYQNAHSSLNLSTGYYGQKTIL